MTQSVDSPDHQGCHGRGHSAGVSSGGDGNVLFELLGRCWGESLPRVFKLHACQDSIRMKMGVEKEEMELRSAQRVNRMSGIAGVSTVLY